MHPVLFLMVGGVKYAFILKIEEVHDGHGRHPEYTSSMNPFARRSDYGLVKHKIT
jgi:hypothetical protein